MNITLLPVPFVGAQPSSLMLLPEALVCSGFWPLSVIYWKSRMGTEPNEVTKRINVMNIKHPIALAAALFTILGGLIVPSSAFAKTAEPPFTRVMNEGGFEIRDYQTQVVAEVSVSGDMAQASNRGFNPLAGYIFGGNAPRSQIAMTAPVTRQKGAQIAMTAPVTRQQAGGMWKVRFIMPAGSVLATMPRPNDPNVRLLEEPGRRYAVIMFAGIGGEDVFNRKTAELAGMLSARRLVAIGKPIFASYDPPWTLPFMRRNEVWIELQKPA